MNRQQFLQTLEREREWDVIIVGGGATGLGAAVDAVTRGLRTALLEAHDFAKGTSSRSTKLVHGGVRYLEQGDIPLVLEALRERGLLHRNAPHLVHHLSFIVPRYKWWEGPFFGIGLNRLEMRSDPSTSDRPRSRRPKCPSACRPSSHALARDSCRRPCPQSHLLVFPR